MGSVQNIKSESPDIVKQLANLLLQQIDEQEPKCLSLGEMASATNTSRKVIHDLLLSLQTDGILKIHRSKIIINRKALAQIAV